MNENIWIEKYRPQKLDDIVGQKHIIERMKILIERIKKDEATLPHLLLSGPPGTGKTTLAMSMIKELYGPNHKILEMNASDDRGIDAVRTKIKTYCRTSSIGGKLNIVFLDEADGLTSNAQEALRRTMERYTKNTRFILSCNYPNKIIDPIRGRCAMLNFYPLTEEDVKNHVQLIAEKENVEITEEAAALIGKSCRGDLRMALNSLHFLSESQRGTIEKKDIKDFMWSVSSKKLTELLKLCLIVKGLSSDKLHMRIKEIDDSLISLYRSGFSDEALINGFFGAIKDLKTSPRLKARLIRDLGELDYRVVIGSNSKIQMRSFLYGILFWRMKK